MKNNSDKVKIKFQDGTQMNVRDFIQKQYKSKISNFFTEENIDTIVYALEAQFVSDMNGEVYRAYNKIEQLAKFKRSKIYKYEKSK